MKKNMWNFFLFCLLLLSGYVHADQDPFSKITVTSKAATFQKENKSLYRLCYKDDVFVTFADSTTVTSDQLEVFVTMKDKSKQKSAPKSDIKKVVFKNNVFMKRKTQKIKANIIELFMVEKKCILSGNVRVEQLQKEKNDVPLITECSRAQLDWDTHDVMLHGNTKKPVRTVITLGGKFRSLAGTKKEKNVS